MSIDRNSSIPLQKQLESIITAQVRSGTLGPGERIPSERELSQIYGVSRVTSKNAVLALLNEGIVTRTPGKGTFIREDVNIGCESVTRHASIAFVLNQPIRLRIPIAQDPVFAGVLEAIHKYGFRKSNHVVFQYVDRSSQDEIKAFRALLEKVDGVVLGAADSDVLTGILERERVPHVLAFPKTQFKGEVTVDFDHISAGKCNVEHLIARGHRDIAILGGPGNDGPAERRFKGAMQAMREHGLEIRSGSSYRSEGWHIADGYAAASKLLGGKDTPSAMSCATDLLAIGALRVCREKRLQVPADISIVGCDNTFLSESSAPRLTSVDTHRAVLGKLAIEHLFALIEDPGFPPISTSMPVRIVERESVRDLLVEGL